MIGWTLAVTGGVCVYAFSLYNGLVTRRARADSAWAQIDVQLKRRHDLVPQLVEAVKGAMAHERSTLDAVVRARADCLGARGEAGQRFKAEEALTSALAPLVMLMERYPDLKASSNVLALQEELASTENRIAMARQHFNDSVAEYNAAIGSVPAVFLARAMGFEPKTPYAAEASAGATPAVTLP